MLKENEITIIFEDQYLLVVNKPAGIHSVMLPSEIMDPSTAQRSVAGFLISKSPEMQAVSTKPEDGGLVHRLDHETSGVLIAAKNREVWRALREAIQSGKVEKEYLAVVVGKFLEPRSVGGFIGSSSRSAKKVRVFNEEPRAKFRVLSAFSRFEPIEYNSELNLSLVRVHAPTARRHQVRALAAHIGHPLWNDKIYGSLGVEGETSNNSAQFILHAASTRFEHPITRSTLNLSAPVPVKILEQFSKQKR